MPDMIEEVLGKLAALAPGNHAGRRADTPGMHARLGGPRQGRITALETLEPA
jgi:hypothetical protein